MPEATVLYTVTAVVVLGLVVWVAAVLKTAREPWARPQSARRSGIESLPPAGGEGERSGGTDAPVAEADPAGIGADSTAKATPAALADARAGSDDDAKA